MFLAITANMIATRCLLHYENNNKMVTIVKVMIMTNNYIKDREMIIFLSISSFFSSNSYKFTIKNSMIKFARVERERESMKKTKSVSLKDNKL